MSHTTRNIIDCLIIGFAAFMYFLAVSNGKLADESLRRELQKPECVAPDQARDLRATCVVIERKA